MPLDPKHDTIWRAIDGHQMPGNFAADLMRDHKIKAETAARAIQEYKRFMYLVATSDGVRRVPSKAVDHVWHAHMMHSRDYWDVFCAAIGRPIHHTPGGQGAAHLRDYDATRRAYVEVFGENPARGIWRKPSRFGTGLMALVGFAFLIGGLFELQNSWLLGGAALVIGGLVFAFGVFAQTSYGQAYLTFEASGEWSDDSAGDCGDGGGCGGD